MELVDLQQQRLRIQESLKVRINAVMSHGQFILGPEVFELEAALARFVGVPHCVSVGNGTDALLIALKALGVGPGDEVILPTFTFVSPAEAAVALGASPVFVDVDPETYLIDLSKIESAITSKTKAIIAVSLFGQCADLPGIQKIASKHKIFTVEDAAQSFGAVSNLKRSCSFSDVSCTSFFPTKPLGAYGDGGACFTSNATWAKAMLQLRSHGQDRRYHHVSIGMNSRLDSVQAAILLSKLEVFEDEIRMRQEVAGRYDQELKDYIKIPKLSPNTQSVYAQYTIQTSKRAQLIELFDARKIPFSVHYPAPLHRQPAYEKYSRLPQPVSEALSQSVLSLPMHPYLSERDQMRVVETIRELGRDT